MPIQPDLVVFGIYLAVVTTVGFVASRKEKVSDDYFLAGQNLTWWIIGGSLIPANISTHHFIGMSGRAVEVGVAIARFEWMAALALVLYGKFFLPDYYDHNPIVVGSGGLAVHQTRVRFPRAGHQCLPRSRENLLSHRHHRPPHVVENQ